MIIVPGEQPQSGATVNSGIPQMGNPTMAGTSTSTSQIDTNSITNCEEINSTG